MKEKFTQGDWQQLNGDGCQKDMIITTTERWDNQENAICEIDVLFDGNHGIEQKANANLITAAPDMYRMLNAICERIHETGQGTIRDILAIETLLAKARGE